MKTVKHESHPAEAELRVLYESGTSAPDFRNLISHVRTCDQCQKVVRRMRSLDLLLRRAVGEHAPKGLTHAVMRELGIAEESTLLYRILQYAAPVFGLIIVVGAVGAAYYYSGAYRQTPVEQSLSSGAAVYSKATTAISGATTAVTSRIREFAPFLYKDKGVVMVSFLTLFFTAIWVMDKFIFSRTMRKRA